MGVAAAKGGSSNSQSRDHSQPPPRWLLQVSRPIAKATDLAMTSAGPCATAGLDLTLTPFQPSPEPAGQY